MDTKARETGQYGKPSKSWIASRLKTLVQLRGGTPDGEVIAAMTSPLSGFTQNAIDKACTALERNMGQYESKMPPLAFLLDACRAAQLQKAEIQPMMGLWRCGGCKATIAAWKAPLGGCRGCGHGSLILLASPEEVPFDHRAYMQDVRAHPERYVRVGDVIREVMDRRRAAGKPIPEMFRDSKQGDAA